MRKALGFVCLGINSRHLICNTSQTISSCFIRGDNDSYQTIAKTFTKGDSHSNKAGCIVFKLTQRPFQNLSIESQELITRNSNKSHSGLASLAGIEYENRDANIENQDTLIKNGDVVIKNRVSILDSCED